MELTERQKLMLECAEDLDIVEGPQAEAIQIKSGEANITLRSGNIVQAISNFWLHRQRNQDFHVSFRFITTATSGLEAGNPFGDGCHGIEYWKRVVAGNASPDVLRSFLLTLPLEENLLSYLRIVDNQIFVEDFAKRIRWEIGRNTNEGLILLLEDKLAIYGTKYGILPSESERALSSLVTKVVNLLSTRGNKELRVADFHREFEKATSILISRAEHIRLLQSMSNQPGNQEIERVNYLPQLPLQPPIPTLEDGTPRINLTSEIISRLDRCRAVFLTGSSGLGKSNLASLVVQQKQLPWGWINFRGLAAKEVKLFINSVARELASESIEPYLILDDLDFSSSTVFETEIIRTILTIKNRSGYLIVTGPLPPPFSILSKAWCTEEACFPAPYFDEQEICDLVIGNGVQQVTKAVSWAKLIYLSTFGHPQLVHARVKNLKAREWPEIPAEEVFRPTDVQQVREEARRRLLEEFPSQGTRSLAYRLSVVSDSFRRSSAIAIGGVSPSIPLPGESFDRLVGPWVERESQDRFRISPLLSDSGNKMLSPEEIRNIHSAIATEIVERGVVNPDEITTAFFYAYLAKDESLLTGITMRFMELSPENHDILAAYLRWFPLLSLKIEERLFQSNNTLDFLLRLLQYRLATSTTEQENVPTIFDRLEESLSNLQKTAENKLSEVLAYSTMLNTVGTQIPSSKVIQFLVRIHQIAREVPAVKELVNKYQDAINDDTSQRINNPIQALFYIHGTRVASINDLKGLFESLKKAPSKIRKLLLDLFRNQSDFSNQVVSLAWLRETRITNFKSEDSIKSLEEIMVIANSWGLKSVFIAATVAKSVLLSEYGDKHDEALAALGPSLRRYIKDPTLLNQKAKVFYHAGAYEDCLQIWDDLLPKSVLNPVENIFSSRLAGIAAAKLNDYQNSHKLFVLGSDLARNTDTLTSLGLGLQAEASFSLWKNGAKKESLTGFCTVLKELGTMPIESDVRGRTLNATIRHGIGWIYLQSIDPSRKSELTEPFPGMFSVDTANLDFDDFVPADVELVWDTLFEIATRLGLDDLVSSFHPRLSERERQLTFRVEERRMVFQECLLHGDLIGVFAASIKMREAVALLPRLKTKELSLRSRDPIPELSSDYWESQQNQQWILKSLLGAILATIDVAENIEIPIESWRRAFLDIHANSTQTTAFLDNLAGKQTGTSSYLEAGYLFCMLRLGNTPPQPLWKATILAVELFQDLADLLEPILDRVFVGRWHFAIDRQKALFQNPGFVTEGIHNVLIDTGLSAYQKLASLLLVSATSLGFRLSQTNRQFLQEKVAEKLS
jgi:hypothetical protein